MQEQAVITRSAPPRRQRLCSAVLAAAALLAFCGCGAEKISPPAPEEISEEQRAMLTAQAEAEISYSRLSGFLSDYSHLKPTTSPQLAGALSYRNPHKKFSLYKIIMIDPVLVHIKHPEAVNPEQLTEIRDLAGRLHGSLKGIFGEKEMISPTPGYGIMRIRIALTDTQPNSPMLGRYRTWSENHPGFGAAAVETEILDSVTGEQLAASIDWRDGILKNLAGYFSQAGEAEESLNEWAGLLKDAIDDSRGLHRGFGIERSAGLFD